jgi:hypothetical protein
MRDVQSGRSPITPKVCAIHNHLRLILRLRSRESGVHVEILRPGVSDAELKAGCQPPCEIQLQGVVAAVPGGVPKEAGCKIRIRPA